MINKLLNHLKKTQINVPPHIGRLIAKIPFEVRPGIGGNYKTQVDAIRNFRNFDIDQKRHFIFTKFKGVFEHAYNNINFYRQLYRQHGIKVEDIRGFDDIKRIPIITKEDLLNVPLEDRSFPVKNRMIVNTGGSSGKPLMFYMDPMRYGNEWAHIHHIWSKLSYEPSCFKLSFDGRSSVDNLIQYDAIRNSFRVDIYAEKIPVLDKLSRIVEKYDIKYLHGYPSAISNFAKACRDISPELCEKLRNTLVGVFLNSEYPAPHFRNTIESIFNVPTQSFYGHTETCVFAEEVERNTYFAHQTYGYAEAVSNSGKTDLVGTSYYNYASPLIRYNTQDLISIKTINSDVLEEFLIKEGRNGEFILDNQNQKISLTGLIYGRHHLLFNVCEHIQVKQERPGEAVILYVTKADITPLQASEMFDSKNVSINFIFRKIETPILTPAGKANLMI